MKRTTLAIVENAAYRRTITEHHLSRLVLDFRFRSCGQTRRLKGTIGMEHSPSARCTGLRRSRFGWGSRGREGGFGRGGALGRRRWRWRLRCRSVPTLFQNTSFDGSQPSHFAAHRDLRLPVHLEHWLGHIAHKVVLAVAVWDSRKLGGDGLDERILLVRHPRPHRLGQALSPLTRQDDHTVHLLLRTREQRLGKPHPLVCQFAYHI